jgi:hypothetical protein
VELTVGLAGLDLSASAPQPMTVAIDGRSHQIRPLDSRDLAAILDCGDVEIARRRLAELALQDWDGPLPASAVDRVAECLERADAANEILLDVACPACAYSWQVDLDVPAFVWSELEGEATRLLHEVASLARAYAWREADILAMPSGRRRFYLEAVG